MSEYRDQNVSTQLW